MPLDGCTLELIEVFGGEGGGAETIEEVGLFWGEPVAQKSHELLTHIAETVVAIDAVSVVDVEQCCHVFVVLEAEDFQLVL